MQKRLYRCGFDELHQGKANEDEEWRFYGLTLHVVSSGDAFEAGRKATSLAVEKMKSDSRGCRLRSIEVVATIDE